MTEASVALKLKTLLGKAILAHAEGSYPVECCGFLLGNATGGHKSVIQIRPAGNLRADSPTTRYSIAPQEFLEAEREGRGLGLDIVGFYHSHPDHPAVPSEYDRQYAWAWYSYLIVPVSAGRAGTPRSWVLADPARVFEEEPLEEEREPCPPRS